MSIENDFLNAYHGNEPEQTDTQATHTEERPQGSESPYHRLLEEVHNTYGPRGAGAINVMEQSPREGLDFEVINMVGDLTFEELRDIGIMAEKLEAFAPERIRRLRWVMLKMRNPFTDQPFPG